MLRATSKEPFKLRAIEQSQIHTLTYFFIGPLELNFKIQRQKTFDKKIAKKEGGTRRSSMLFHVSDILLTLKCRCFYHTL